MAITRKPKPQTNGAEAPAVDIESLINKGGSVASAQTAPKGSDVATVNLRIPATLVERIDQELKSRPIKTPRHTWLLEAVVEKLNREQ